MLVPGRQETADGSKPTDAWTADHALVQYGYFLGSLITVTLNGSLVSTVEGADDVKSKVHDVGTPYVCGIGRVTGRVQRGGGRGGETLAIEKWSRSAMQDVGRLCIFPTAQQRGRRTLLYWVRILSYQSL